MMEDDGSPAIREKSPNSQGGSASQNDILVSPYLPPLRFASEERRMGHTPGLDDAAKTMNVLDFKIVVSQNPTDVSVFNRKTTERYFSPDVFSRLSKARIRSKQYTSPVAKNALSRGVKCKRRSSFVHLKRRDDLMNCQKRGSKLSRKSESSSDSDNEDDDAASSRNSLVLEKRFTASRFASDYCYQPDRRRLPSFPKSQQSILRNIDGLSKIETEDEDRVIWNSFLFHCKKAFFFFTWLLVPGTFGYGPKAATASVVATLTALGLWSVVLVTAIGSIIVFIHVGRVNNLFTVVSVNPRLEAPSLAFCPVTHSASSPSLLSPMTDYWNQTIRIRLNYGDEFATAHTTTETCYRESLAHCGCVYLWKLKFWKHNTALLKPSRPRLAYLYANTWEEHHRTDDSLSVAIELNGMGLFNSSNNLEEDSSEIIIEDINEQRLILRRAPQIIRVGLFSSVSVKNQDSPAWMPIKVGSSTAAYLTLERFWEINFHRTGLLYLLLAVHEHRTFRFETITLPTVESNRAKELQQHYRLPYEETLSPHAFTSGVSHDLYRLLREMLHYVEPKAPDSGPQQDYSIPVFARQELPFNWSSPYITELHFEFRSFFTTESFRVGHRMNILRVWGLVLSILASLNYLDLFYAVFPRYRGRHPRLVVSKFIRVVTCGIARDNHSTKKIPVPGD